MAAATPIPRAAIAHARALLADGADILDIGGESTRPGAAPVAERDELARILPVVAALAADGAIVSVDTTKPAVMRAAIEAGATMINDVRRARGAGCARRRRRERRRGVPDAHARRAADDAGGPRLRRRRRRGPRLSRGPRARRARRPASRASASCSIPASASARRWRIIFPCCMRCRRWRQPAIRCWPACRASRCWARSPAAPSANGWPRASAAALAAVARGAAIVRVHDVRETVDALKVWSAAGIGTGWA